MTEGTFPKTDGDVAYASEINNLRNVNLMLVQALNFRTVKSTGYVYWDTGKIRVGNKVYDITGSNSGASKTDKLIIATLDSSLNTAVIDFEATNYTFVADEIVLGYVDASSRLYLFGQGGLLSFDGYTFTKFESTTADTGINVNGEGYFLSVMSYCKETEPQGVATAQARTQLTLTIDTNVLATTDTNITDEYTASLSGLQVGLGPIAISHIQGPIKFNSNLTVGVNHTIPNGIAARNVDYKTEIYYYLK